MRKNLARFLCLALIAPMFLAFGKCNPAQSIPLAQAGYQVHVYALATLKSAKAINTYQPTALQNGTYIALLGRVDSLDDLAERLFFKIDNTPEIGPSNKLELLTEADSYLALADGVIADRLFPSLPESVRETLLIGRSLASGIKLAISTVTVTQPTTRIGVNAAEANAKAKSATKAAKSKNATSDLIQALSQIVSDTAADVLAARGLDVLQVRELRKVKRLAVARFVMDERARLGL